jgi:hypothetical protein
MSDATLTFLLHLDDWTALESTGRQQRYADAVRHSGGRYGIRLRTAGLDRGEVRVFLAGHGSSRRHYRLFPRTRLRRDVRREVDAAFPVTRDDRPLEIRCDLPEWEHRLGEAFELDYPCAVTDEGAGCRRR